MCGLAGRFNAHSLAPVPEWHGRADALLAHRGPDGSGHYVDACCELVHRRLALVDLTPTGAQPMPNEDGEIRLVFNGEIYNHRALRETLRRQGHHFRGTSDTEVIVHLYEELGSAMTWQLQGIFAFALYDRRLNRVLLGRDRFGVKPLFIAGPTADGEWLFASEIKALLAHPGLPRRLDRQACFDFFGLGFVPEPATGFVGIRALAPGTLLSIDGDSARQTRFAPAIARPAARRTLSEAVEDCGKRLTAAVARQSSADVPVAMLLSGGIDSSLVVAAHRHAFGEPPQTFSVGFPDAAFDESAAARQVAAHCSARHREVFADLGALELDTTLDLLRHFDQPFADTSFLPTYWVSRAIREAGLICTLSGDGGDELFGGYPRVWRAPVLHRLARAPGWVRRGGVIGGRLLQRVTRDVGRRVAKAAALATAGRADSAALLGGLSSYLDEEDKGALLLADAHQGLAPTARLFDGYDTAVADSVEELSRRVTETMFRVSLPSDMLRKVDMMSMRASIEVRVPLLDDEVADLGFTLPHHLKTDGRRGKLVLRGLAERWLPRTIARAPKRGFGAPLDVLASPRFHAACADLLRGPLSRTAPILAPGRVDAWLGAFQAAARGKGDGSMSRGAVAHRLLSLLSLELWMREYRLTW